jgi:hypothetical protein
LGAAAGVAALLASAANAGRTAVTGKTADGRNVSTLQRVSAGISAVTNFGMSETGGQIGDVIARRIVEALRGATINATVAPHDLEHAATRNHSRRAE